MGIPNSNWPMDVDPQRDKRTVQAVTAAMLVLIIVCGALCCGLFSVIEARREKADARTVWHKRAVCPCGYHRETPNGTLWDLDILVCPVCGLDYKASRGWEVKTMRYVDEQWETRQPSPDE